MVPVSCLPLLEWVAALLGSVRTQLDTFVITIVVVEYVSRSVCGVFGGVVGSHRGLRRVVDHWSRLVYGWVVGEGRRS